MNSNVRVRFAPSPTGPLHIGGLRTALYNYLFARKHQGSFILRIEDTDQNRYVPGAEEYIKQSLQWCGLNPDEGPDQGGLAGPYRQSERASIYQEYVELLLKKGKAYYAFDTVEELEAMRQQEQGHAKYDSSTRQSMRNSLTINKEEVEKLVAEGKPYVIRMLVPEARQIHFVDRIRGEVEFDSAELDDKVILKADGLPTYHLANVVDDHLMQITHVIRGEEWLSSTAHHVLLYEALEWQDTMPEFAHLPLILKPTGKGKLSKRDGQKFGFPVFPLAWQDGDPNESFEGFDTFGFNPEALVNFLAFLGWNPGTETEIFTLSQLTQAFSLDQIGKSGARFDYDKALWYNSQYLSKMDPLVFRDAIIPFLDKAGFDPNHSKLTSICQLMQDRIKTYAELPDACRFFFNDIEQYDEVTISKKWNSDTKLLLMSIRGSLNNTTDFNAEKIKSMVSELINQAGVKFGDILPLLRIALTGEGKGADVFSIMEILGAEATLDRLDKAEAVFSGLKPV